MKRSRTPVRADQAKERAAGELRAVVRDDLLRQAVMSSKFVEQMHGPLAGDRDVGQERRALPDASSTMRR
jgi:hypothetical protein